MASATLAFDDAADDTPILRLGGEREDRRDAAIEPQHRRASQRGDRRPHDLGTAPPIEFLVIPRILDLGVIEYDVRTIEAISVADCVAGLIKASVFGALIAMAGCLRGIQYGRSSAAVGAATTSAVMTGIVPIVVSDAVTTVVFDLIEL